MHSFRYIPPGPEEQRSFVVQFAGSLAGLLLLGGLWFRAGPGMGRAELCGAALGVLWLLSRTAWALEKKARRAQQAEIAYDETGLHLTDANGVTRLVKWEEIAELSVVGGRLTVQWPGGKLAVGAREIENGMELVQAVCAEYGRRHGGGRPPTNFIPLTPR